LLQLVYMIVTLQHCFVLLVFSPHPFAHFFEAKNAEDGALSSCNRLWKLEINQSNLLVVNAICSNCDVSPFLDDGIVRCGQN